MASINYARVGVGALAAGVVINVVESVMNLLVLADAMEQMTATLGLPPMGGGAMGGFVLMAFAMGFLLTWTYAAIRPRFGPGPATALKAGAAVWAAFYLLGQAVLWLMGMIDLHLYLITLAYSLPMMLAAGAAGGWAYKEE